MTPLTYVQLEDEIERLRASHAELLAAAKEVMRQRDANRDERDINVVNAFCELKAAIAKAEEQAPNKLAAVNAELLAAARLAILDYESASIDQTIYDGFIALQAAIRNAEEQP